MTLCITVLSLTQSRHSASCWLSVCWVLLCRLSLHCFKLNILILSVIVYVKCCYAGFHLNAKCHSLYWIWCSVKLSIMLNVITGNTKGGSITVPLTSCLTDLESAVWQLAIFVFICKIIVFPGHYINCLMSIRCWMILMLLNWLSPWRMP